MPDETKPASAPVAETAAEPAETVVKTPANLRALVDVHYMPPGARRGTRPKIAKKGAVFPRVTLGPKDIPYMLTAKHIEETDDAVTPDPDAPEAEKKAS
jgi:hypothetical protein